MLLDEQLLSAWRAGDRVAGDQLVARYFGAVFRFFASKLGEDVADLTQDTFLRCVQTSTEPASFRAYLFAVARNLLVDHFRARAVRPGDNITLLSLEDLQTSATQRIARDETQDAVLAALRRIPLDQQIALELAYWEGLGGPEIAEVLGIPPNTVRARLSRARAALKTELGDVDIAGLLSSSASSRRAV